MNFQNTRKLYAGYILSKDIVRRIKTPQEKPITSSKYQTDEGAGSADTHIETYFKERKEQELYEQVKGLKPYQREKKLEKVASLWLRELK